MTSEPSNHLDQDAQPAAPAPKTIVLRVRRDRIKGNKFAVQDPANRAPVHAAARGRIIAEALEAEARRLKFALYLHLTRLYVSKFYLKLLRARVLSADC